MNRNDVQRLLDQAPSDWRSQFSHVVKKGEKPTIDVVLRALQYTAGGNPSGEPLSGPHKVPDDVRRDAAKGLLLSWENNYGAWNFIGVARAIQLVVMPGISDVTLSRMKAYFSRHRNDKRSSNFGNDKDPSRGYMAWFNWGGDAADRWLSMSGKTSHTAAKHNSLALLNSDYNFLGRGANVAKSTNAVYCEALTVLIERLRALKWLSWNAHWMASGPTSYSDHLLFERIYDAIDKQVDTVAENLFGSNPSLTKASWALGVQHNVTDYVESVLGGKKDSVSAKDVMTALRDVHRACQDVLDLKANLAAEDFAPAIAKRMETFIYLLQQRGA